MVFPVSLHKGIWGLSDDLSVYFRKMCLSIPFPFNDYIISFLMNKTTNSMSSLVYACRSAILPLSLSPPEVFSFVLSLHCEVIIAAKN